MASGFGCVGVMLVAALFGCRPAPLSAPPLAPPVAPPEGKLLNITPAPAASDATTAAAPPAREARVEGGSVWVADASYKSEELVAELRRRRSGATLLKVQVAPDSSDEAVAEVLQAAPRAGFEQVGLERAGESLTIAVGDGSASVRLMAWRSGQQLVVYDLKPAPDTKALLGPFDVANEAGQAALREQLTRACQGPCSAELALLPEVPPTLWQTLSTWHRNASGIPALSYQVVAIVPRSSSGKPPSQPTMTSPPVSDKPPKVRMGATTVSGRLPPVVIQHIVRSNFGKFRMCYEAGLGRNAELTGRVSARFVIDRTGKVSNVADGGSDLPDPEVVSCVLKAMYTLSFPPPANGIVTVVYPIMFAPG